MKSFQHKGSKPGNAHLLPSAAGFMADTPDRAALSHLRDLSSSLADIAAFMHEVEVQQGFVSRKNDGRGIERIRQLAYRLQGIPVGQEVI